MHEHSSFTCRPLSWVWPVRRVCMAMVMAMLACSLAWAQDAQSLVTGQHLAAINQAFSRNGILAGRVESDPYGRVILKGEYADEQ